jgi:hypothetical protein
MRNRARRLPSRILTSILAGVVQVLVKRTLRFHHSGIKAGKIDVPVLDPKRLARLHPALRFDRILVDRHRHSHDVVTCLVEDRGGKRGVHAAAHSQHNHLPAARLTVQAGLRDDERV